MSKENDSVRLGLTAAIGAYLLWGVFPLFWKQLGDFDPVQTVGHRIVWAFAFLTLLSFWFLGSQSDRQEFFRALRSPAMWRTYTLAAILVAMNWLTFVWAMGNDQVVQASFGYYINPLMNVVLGVFLLGERLSRIQWIAISLAALGVVILGIALQGLPWVSLVLACSFAVYSLVKKKSSLPAFQGLYLETMVLFLPALGFLIFTETTTSQGAIQVGDAKLLTLLVLAGTVTIAPLALFAFAAQRAPLSMIGVLQYIAPTMQFLLGVFLYGEKVDTLQLCGFGCVWLALIIFVVSSQFSASSETSNSKNRTSS
ncbi:MAG: EamA family transporter RarD [Planctomycetota bacterium]